MYRFFISKNQIFEDTHKVLITGEDVNHIKNVLRMKPGEEISVMVPGEENEYRCSIAGYENEEIICDLLFVKESDVELPCEIVLYQALPKADKMELIIQKAVELGAARIVPVATKRAVVKMEGAKEEKKIARWNKISEAAAKQSKRALIPSVTEVYSFDEAVKEAKECKCKIIPYELSDPSGMESTREILRDIAPGDKVAIFIGPEGGFSDDEVELATQNGIVPITLGHRILRTETAGMVVLSWLVLMLER